MTIGNLSGLASFDSYFVSKLNEHNVRASKYWVTYCRLLRLLRPIR